jgi:hypothetical protein
MNRKPIALLLSGILLTSALDVRSIHAQTGQRAKTEEDARSGIKRLGVGQDARAEITLRDKKKLKGYVSMAGEGSFTFVDQKTGASQTIAYADVVTVKKAHRGLKTSTWIILAAVAVATVIVGIIVRPAFCDGC